MSERLRLVCLVLRDWHIHRFEWIYSPFERLGCRGVKVAF
jgi:hypothetical protein